MWWQRARADFLKFGDANTRWFHSKASMRRERNAIYQIQDDNGVLQTDPKAIGNVIVHYFSKLFKGAENLQLEPILQRLQPRVTEEMNAQLNLPYHKAEIEAALAQMNPHKAPRPDGFNAYFFQKHWDVVGDDVAAAVLAILNGQEIPPKLNLTFVALIPKKANPLLVSEYRLISLYNVMYKLVTEVMSNRLKPLLAVIVLEL